MAASASATFVAADVSMAVDVGVALAHPTPANRAVVVGDAVALGYGIGKALGAAVSKYGPSPTSSSLSRRGCRRAAPCSTRGSCSARSTGWRPSGR